MVTNTNFISFQALAQDCSSIRIATGAAAFLIGARPSEIAQVVAEEKRLQTGPKVKLSVQTSDQQLFGQMMVDLRALGVHAQEEGCILEVVTNGSFFSVLLSSKKRIKMLRDHGACDQRNPMVSTSISMDATGRILKAPPMTQGKKCHLRALVIPALTSQNASVPSSQRPGGIAVGIQLTNELDTAGAMRLMSFVQQQSQRLLSRALVQPRKIMFDHDFALLNACVHTLSVNNSRSCNFNEWLRDCWN